MRIRPCLLLASFLLPSPLPAAPAAQPPALIENTLGMVFVAIPALSLIHI